MLGRAAVVWRLPVGARVTDVVVGAVAVVALGHLLLVQVSPCCVCGGRDVVAGSVQIGSYLDHVGN